MTALLVIIYVAFISLGLPDSLLGAAWPVMRADLSVPLAAAGILSMIVSFGTIVSSLMSNRLVRRFGTGRITVVSVFMTAAALLGFSFAPSLWVLCLLAVPLGLGAGSIDAALNNFVALHYSARQMSFLHCFWGIGVTVSPIIMAACIAGVGWRGGYRIVSGLQFALFAALVCTMRLWRRAEGRGAQAGGEEAVFVSNREALRLRGIAFALLTFLLYCGAETTTGLWMASYLAEYRGLEKATAAAWGSCFFAGITVGRVLSGLLATRLSSCRQIRLGGLVMLAGAVLLLLPVQFALPGLLLLGVGGGPIYPCMIHETPRRFGRDASQAAMGLQMAVAYVGSTFLPPLLGAIAGATTLLLIPVALLCLTAVMFVCSELVERFIRRDARRA